MPRSKLNVGNCIVKNCTAAQKVKNMCGSHYSQWKRTGKTGEIKERKEIYCDGWRHCASCKNWVPIEQFRYRSDSKGTVHASKCLRCASLARHNITAFDFDKMLFKQQGKCAGCGIYAREGTRLHVDHDHKCCAQSKKTCGKCIRGLLCERCNWTLGKVEDSVENLQKLITYLERFN